MIRSDLKRERAEGILATVLLKKRNEGVRSKLAALHYSSAIPRGSGIGL
jgi:hypothetical protein